MEKEKYWSRFADNFNAKQQYVTGIELRETIFQELVKLQNLGHVLEFACGNGAYTKVILKSAKKITATDYSEEMIEHTKKIFSNNAQIIVEQANCHKTTYSNEAFDTVFMAHLIHVIDNPANVLTESYRLLKTGGSLIIVSFSIDKMKTIDKISLLNRYKKTFGKLPENRTNFTLKSLSKLVENHNFKIQKAILLGQKTKAIYIVAKKSISSPKLRNIFNFQII